MLLSNQTPEATRVDEFDERHLNRAVDVAREARAHGNHPFGAVLVAADGRVVEAENTVVTGSDPTGHAETNAVRLAAARWDATTLASSTLYASTEPCAMCSGAIFWAGIARVVYALSELELFALLPEGSTEGVLELPTREVFARGRRSTVVVGPVALPGAAAVHSDFWE